MSAPLISPAPVEVVAAARPIREVNREIRTALAEGNAVVVRDTRSRHNLGVALPAGRVSFDGSVGYYCGGLNHGADVVVHGRCGWGAAEAMNGGSLRVSDVAGMGLGASMREGLIVAGSDAGPRCGVAMKGGEIVVAGSVGYSCAFMAHAGRVICLGDAADATGDSLWGGSVWVAGKIAGLGIDAVVVEPDADEVAGVEARLAELELDGAGRDWKKVVSGRKLWHFESRDAQQWLMI